MIDKIQYKVRQIINSRRKPVDREQKVKDDLLSAFSFNNQLIPYNYEPVLIGDEMYAARREWEHRWSLIKEQIEAYQVKSVLDIGCAEGWFLRRAAEDFGCFAIGVDNSRRMVSSEIARLHDEAELYAIIRANVSAQDILKLPRCELVLCLSVVHHVVRDSGMETARDFVKAVISRAEKAIIFEMGTADENDGSWHEVLPDMPQGQEVFIREFLESAGLKNIRMLGGSPSFNKVADRYIFVGEPTADS